MSDEPDERLNELFTALGHAIRIEIVQILKDEGVVGFTHLVKQLDLSVGSLYYHLEVLGDLIQQTPDRKYTLTEKGNLAYQLIQTNREQLESAPSLPLADTSTRSKIIRELLFGRRIFATITTDPKRAIPELLVLLILGGIVLEVAQFEPILLFFNTIPTIPSPGVVFLEFIANWVLLYGLCEILTRILFQRSESHLSLLIGVAFAILPQLIIPTIVVLNNLLRLGFQFDAFLITAALLICQAWTVCLLTAAIGYAKGLLLEKAAVISFGVVYINIVFMVLFVLVF